MTRESAEARRLAPLLGVFSSFGVVAYCLGDNLMVSREPDDLNWHAKVMPYGSETFSVSLSGEADGSQWGACQLDLTEEQVIDIVLRHIASLGVRRG